MGDLVLHTLGVAAAIAAGIGLFLRVVLVVARANARPADVSEPNGPGLMDFGKEDGAVVFLGALGGAFIGFGNPESGDPFVLAFTGMALVFLLDVTLRLISVLWRVQNRDMYGDKGEEAWLHTARRIARPRPTWSEATPRYRRMIAALLVWFVLFDLAVGALIATDNTLFVVIVAPVAGIVLLVFWGFASQEIDAFADSLGAGGQA